MALDEPKDNDNTFEQEGYTVVIDPAVTEITGPITIEQHRFGGLYFATGTER